MALLKGIGSKTSPKWYDGVDRSFTNAPGNSEAEIYPIISLRSIQLDLWLSCSPYCHWVTLTLAKRDLNSGDELMAAVKEAIIINARQSGPLRVVLLQV